MISLALILLQVEIELRLALGGVAGLIVGQRRECHAQQTHGPSERIAKGFAHDVCEPMARDNPDLYLIKMAKSQREGRIFLDYLRNDRMATAVAPLSPRARPGATVSMPLTWTQVKSDLDPKRFTVRTVPSLLAKSSAWQDYCDGQRPLEQAIKRLGKSKRAA